MIDGSTLEVMYTCKYNSLSYFMTRIIGSWFLFNRVALTLLMLRYVILLVNNITHTEVLLKKQMTQTVNIKQWYFRITGEFEQI